jgi:hypothetical protein
LKNLTDTIAIDVFAGIRLPAVSANQAELASIGGATIISFFSSGYSAQPIPLHARNTRHHGNSIHAIATAIRSTKPAARRNMLPLCLGRCYLGISFIRRSNMGNRHEKRRSRGLLGGMILIVVGMVLLLERNGIIDRQLVFQWWPLLLVLIGGWLVTRRLGRNGDAP